MTKPTIMQVEQAQRVAEHFDITVDEALQIPPRVLAVFDRRVALVAQKTPNTEPQPQRKEEYEPQILNW